ncbi:threonine/serine exporter family protein [Metabacillus sp. GX 13764]|uniref:threonine/serine exporter family protein n=1 Tax=Metabacillus kandeliae TaxID=2900151 RepID=UPI001E3201CD|nr:threonine/serine exporter family protein [Metabacillus kandeliae]MCD7034012.1 threonine/serine exporter family protein [Metabacillus kandeliae]
MKNEPLLTYEIMDVCLLGGKIMLQSGAETYRVEDTMTRMAAAFGFEDSNSYVTPTGIIFSIEGREPTKTKLIRILQRTTDLEKVAQVNQVSRRISSGEMTLGEAYAQLKHIEASGHTYPFWIQLIAAAISSGCFTIMFMGHWPDFIPSVIAGGAGFLTLHYSHRLVPIKFFSEFAASFVIGLLSMFFLSHGFGHELDKMIIGSVMPLVPGLLITNAVRDLMVGHLVSGLSKGAEAFLTAFAIGSGIAVVFALM